MTARTATRTTADAATAAPEATAATDVLAPALTALDVALKDLALHPLNARAASAAGGHDEDIAALAASIAALGLLNPLIVQRQGRGWGVLAGGRRLAALRRLAGDRSEKGWTTRTPVPCRALPDDLAAATAITLAENVTQRAMEPLDEYEAFACMMEVGGHDADSIARLFGVERRRVVERLRYGRVDPAIRTAVRAREVSLDALKAFAEHPDQAAQRAVFDGLRTAGTQVTAWAVRERLRDRGVRLGDPLGQLVLDAYRTAGGAMAADLIEEDSRLTDAALVERLLMAALEGAAEAERSRLGFAWSGAMRAYDWKAMQGYGRVHVRAVEPEGEAALRCAAIAERLAAIEAAFEGEAAPEDAGTDFDELEAEHERLGEEHDALTHAWAPEDLARAGVLAVWDGDGVATYAGLVRPEDRAAPGASGTGGVAGPAGAMGGAGGPFDTGGVPGGAGAPAGPDSAFDDDAGGAGLALSESLRVDLRTEQAMAIGAALAGQPALAQDLVLFKVAADLLGRCGGVSHALGVTASNAERPHGKRDGMDPQPQEALARLHEGLDWRWWDENRPVPQRFEAFRALSAETKARIVAVALADAVRPAAYDRGETLMRHVASEVVPDLRAVWRPTGEAFFVRLKKSALLALLAGPLRQPEEAARLASATKREVADHLDRLFAAPFATLTPEQRGAVEAWCPPGMAIAPAPGGATVGDAADARVEGCDEPPADAEADPDETGEAEVADAEAERLPDALPA